VRKNVWKGVVLDLTAAHLAYILRIILTKDCVTFKTNLLDTCQADNVGGVSSQLFDRVGSGYDIRVALIGQVLGHLHRVVDLLLKFIANFRRHFFASMVCYVNGLQEILLQLTVGEMITFHPLHRLSLLHDVGLS